VLCCEAFNILRASSNLILNLLLLMVDAGVADLKGEQDVLKVRRPYSRVSAPLATVHTHPSHWPRAPVPTPVELPLAHGPFAPRPACPQVAEKLRLDLSDEEAALYFQELISESVSSLFPQINETIHRWAQYWRS
jgi:phosphatidylinositol 3-kinase